MSDSQVSVQSGPEHDSRLMELVEQFAGRIQAGEPIDLEGFVREHPTYAEPLRRLLPAVRVLNDLGRSAPHDGTPPHANTQSVVTHGPVQGVLGDFRIIREIGRGGMGVVYEAEQISLRRQVALKVLPLAAMLDDRQLQRFKNEAQAAAMLRHPNIVGVHSVGCDRGVHYYAMEFIDGQSMSQLVDQLRDDGQSSAGNEVMPSAETHPIAALSTEYSEDKSRFFRSVARLGVQAAEALEYAHQEGVVHRDIKPSNLLLDKKGKLWITDFGLAQIQGDHTLTMSGDLLGTLRYMSPEQASGDKLLDCRTDIYSLGITLYELLTSQPAITSRDRQQILKQVVEQSPLSPRKLLPAIPTDLDTIVLKSTATIPAERYDTAQQMADDLRCFMDHKPIKASRPTLAQRISKWSRRHKTLASSLAASVVVLLLAVSAVSALIADRERSARLRSEQAKNQIAAQSRQISRLLAGSYMDKAQALCERGEIGAGMLWLAHSLNTAPSDAVALRRAIRVSLASWSRQLHWQRAVLSHDVRVAAAAFSTDGTRIATGCADGGVWLWDVATGQPIGQPLHHETSVSALAFSADGSRLVSGERNGGNIWVWDLNTRNPIGQPLRHRGVIRTLAISPDGSLVLATNGGAARLWNLTTGKLVSEHGDPGVLLRIAEGVFTSAGPRLVKLNLQTGGHAQLWDASDGRSVGQPTTATFPDCWHAGVSLDGAYFVVSQAEEMTVCSTETGDAIGPPARAGSAINRVVLNYDGSRLLSGHSDWKARVWDTATGRQVGQPLQHEGLVSAVAFSTDGSRIVTAGRKGTARVWNAAMGSGQSRLPIAEGAMISDATYSPDGSRLAVSDWQNPRAWIVDVTTGEMTIVRHPVGTFGRGGMWGGVQFSPDNSLLVSGAVDGAICFWDARTGLPAREPLAHYGDLRAIAFNADGSQIISAAGRTVQRWDVTTGRRLGDPLAHQGRVTELAISPDGSRILTSNDSTVRLWDSETLTQVGEALEHDSEVEAIAFNPDGSPILVALANGTAKLWDASTREPAGQVVGHEMRISAVSFSPDGTLTLTGSHDGTARFWDSATGKAIGPPIRYGNRVGAVAFSPNSQKALVGGLDGEIQIWQSPPVPVNGDADTISVWTEAITGLKLDPDEGGSIRVLDERQWEIKRQNLQRSGELEVATYAPTPNEPDSYQLLERRVHAADLLRQGLSADALSYVDHVVRSGTGYCRDLVIRGHALAQVGRPEEGEIDLTNAIQMRPEDPQSWIERGTFYIGSGRPDAAEADFKKAIELGAAQKPRLCMSRWWVLGPDTKESQPSLSFEVDSADALSLINSSDGAWRVWFSDTQSLLDLEGMFDRAKDMTAYALRYVYSSEKQQLALLVGFDDPLKVWLNGSLVHQTVAAQAGFPHHAAPDMDAAPVTLNRGWNSLLVKVTNGQGLHGVYLRFSDLQLTQLEFVQRATIDKDPSDVAAADLDGDGDLDVLSAFYKDGRITWRENTDGSGTFGPPKVITTDAPEVDRLVTADLDRDGDLDIVSKTMKDRRIVWYENTDGAGSFSPASIVTTSSKDPQSVEAADIDGDGDLDVLCAFGGYDRRSPAIVSWRENIDGAGKFGPERVVTTSGVAANSVRAADLDNDGDLDVVFAAKLAHQLVWHENTGGSGNFGPENVITARVHFPWSIDVSDLDGDGDLDVVSASEVDDKVAWYENTDGAGTFGPQRVITTSADTVVRVAAVDLDGDEDTDIVSANWHGHIAWYENTDGTRTFGPRQLIVSNANNAWNFELADLDGDGDNDLLTPGCWYENGGVVGPRAE